MAFLFPYSKNLFLTSSIRPLNGARLIFIKTLFVKGQNLKRQVKMLGFLAQNSSTTISFLN